MAVGVLFCLREERPGVVRPEGGRPGVTILVSACNGEQVITRCVRALRRLESGPHSKRVVPDLARSDAGGPAGG